MGTHRSELVFSVKSRRQATRIPRTSQGNRLNLDKPQGFALKPTRRLCLLDLQQRARPFAICPLVGVLRGPTRTSRGHCRPPQEPNQNERFQGPLPLAGLQGAAPLGGVRGKAPSLALIPAILL